MNQEFDDVTLAMSVPKISGKRFFVLLSMKEIRLSRIANMSVKLWTLSLR